MDGHAVEDARELIEAKVSGKRVSLKELGKHPESGAELTVHSGRYGPYVTDGDVNATLPKGLEPEDLDLETAIQLVDDKAARGGGKGRRGAKGAKGAQGRRGQGRPQARPEGWWREEEVVKTTVTVVGGGLAGCEAALQLAAAGHPVRLVEMRPVRTTPAHQSDRLGELVCTNSFKSEGPENAHGQLKREMRALGSLLLRSADRTRVAAGSALAVDRHLFSQAMTGRRPGLAPHRGRPRGVRGAPRRAGGGGDGPADVGRAVRADRAKPSATAGSPSSTRSPRSCTGTASTTASCSRPVASTRTPTTSTVR